MELFVSILSLIAGIWIVVDGADALTEGASSIASRLGISQLVIGLTIVACGTSMPEFCVSLVSALKGTPDLAVGNVIGSNIFNTLLIAGVAAAIVPISILPQTVKRDFPIAALASILVLIFCIDHNFTRVEALILTICFIAFMWLTLRTSKASPEQENEDSAIQLSNPQAIWKILYGLLFLVGGSQLFVDSATSLAQSFGVSEAIIGLTIVAGGTSMPELATSIVAARKGNSGIAIGNVLGSNIFNILFILGIAGLICPMHPQGITIVDFSVALGSCLLLWLFSWTNLTIKRWEGLCAIIIYLVYLAFLISQL